MLKIIAVIVVIVLVILASILIYAATKPDTFRVERSATIKAPPEKIFPLIDDFAQWRSWSPYEGKDPAMTREMSAVTAGKGATYAWKGNRNVGEGRMEIVESTPSSKIAIKLDFISPIEGHNVATFTLQPVAEGTNVTWAMDGPSPYIAKVMGVVFDMDKMIGTDFAAGLENLKNLAEK